jgi:NAD(P)-dependent dehydrogenase (short-subunit alcohol dehydrogenase family)
VSDQSAPAVAALEGLVAVVTGAGRGIGRGISQALAAAGAQVALVDQEIDLLRESTGLIEATRGSVEPYTCDVGDRAQVSDVVSSVAARFGRIDVLVNNAQALRPGVPLSTCPVEDLDLTLHSGLWGTFHFMQLCYPYLARRGGSVINLGSSAGTHGQRGLGAYAAAKEGIRGLSKVAALEWGADGITVNVICPSVMSPSAWAWADAHPDEYRAIASRRAVPRDGDAVHDVGRTVVFLASRGASFITGQTLMVNGGASLAP